MFISFGMSTFSGEEHGGTSQPAALQAPNKLDVRQWVRVARDAGMKCAVITTKHTAGFCLWPHQRANWAALKLLT